MRAPTRRARPLRPSGGLADARTQGWLPPRRPPGFGPRGRRARRGAVKAAVLVLLDEEPRNGYALMQEIEARSEGAWRPSPGSIYPALAMMEDEGLIKSVGSRRRARVRAHRRGPRAAGTARRGRARSMGAGAQRRGRRDGRAVPHDAPGRHGRRARSPRSAPPSSSSRPSRPWPQTRRTLYGLLAEDPEGRVRRNPSPRAHARGGFCCTFTRCREDGSDRRCRVRGRRRPCCCSSRRGARRRARRAPRARAPSRCCTTTASGRCA